MKAIVLLVALVSVVSAQPSDVHVKLSFANNKTVSRIGESIKLVMEFTADTEGAYHVEILDDGDAAPSDTVLISPETGVTKWTEEMFGGYPYARDLLSSRRLTSSPTVVELTLNDRLRFESPGRYTISVTTRRVSRNSPLTT